MRLSPCRATAARIGEPVPLSPWEARELGADLLLRQPLRPKLFWAPGAELRHFDAHSSPQHEPSLVERKVRDVVLERPQLLLLPVAIISVLDGCCDWDVRGQQHSGVASAW